MKAFIRTTLFLLLVYLYMAPATAQTLPNGCVDGRRHGIYYTDCFPRALQDLDDTVRLRNAVNAALGKLIFNEGNYDVSEPISIPSHRILIGTGVSGNGTFPTSKIRLNLPPGTDTIPTLSVFKIGSCRRDIVVRDLGLVNNISSTSTRVQNTVGIWAEGQNTDPACPDNAGASFNFEFSNAGFFGFHKGIG